MIRASLLDLNQATDHNEALRDSRSVFEYGEEDEPGADKLDAGRCSCNFRQEVATSFSMELQLQGKEFRVRSMVTCCRNNACISFDCRRDREHFDIFGKLPASSIFP